MRIRTQQKIITSARALDAFAREYVRNHIVRPRSIRGEGNRKHAMVTALFGDMGSGKTSFTQAVAKTLGIKSTVISPTFIIERVYKIEKPPFSHFIHIDCYRLSDNAELKALGWGDMVRNKSNIIFIEWAERVENILPEDATRVHLEFVDEHTRKIKIFNSNGS
ncbi:MAG: tRNA (adenosine(37)-N6)-threonylcarbamoyltransferase complex ATPase subunit type 1 TsaE [Patescibacteria group bacterium]